MALLPALLLVQGPDHGRIADIDTTQPEDIVAHAGDTQPQGVVSAGQRGGGQQPVAGHVPAAREGLFQAGITPEQCVVEVDRAGHGHIPDCNGHGLAAQAFILPLDAIPHRVVSRPADVPGVRQRDRDPAISRWPGPVPLFRCGGDGSDVLLTGRGAGRHRQ